MAARSSCAEASRTRNSIIGYGLPAVPNARRSQDDSREVLAVVIQAERFVPGAGSFGYSVWYEPGGGMHHAAEPAITKEVVSRGQTEEKGVVVVKLGLGRVVCKSAPATCEGLVGDSRLVQLSRDLIRGQQVVRVEILDKIASGGCQREIPGCGCPAVRLLENPDAPAGERAGDAQTVVGRTVIDHNNLYSGPILSQGR
jgi:hypothetical protein